VRSDAGPIASFAAAQHRGLDETDARGIVTNIPFLSALNAKTGH
jgi:hypothetical protein